MVPLYSSENVLVLLKNWGFVTSLRGFGGKNVFIAFIFDQPVFITDYVCILQN